MSAPQQAAFCAIALTLRPQRTWEDLRKKTVRRMMIPALTQEIIMDDELFRRVYPLACQQAPTRGKRQQFSDAVIVSVYSGRSSATSR